MGANDTANVDLALQSNQSSLAPYERAELGSSG